MVGRSASLLVVVATLFALPQCAIDDRDLEEHGASDDKGGSSNGGSSNGGSSNGGSSNGGSSNGGSSTGGSSTGGSSTGGTAGNPACAPEADDSDCFLCQKANCCDELVACALSADCAAFLDCGIACPDATCLGGCVDDHPEGAVLFDDLDSCVNTQCDICLQQ